MSCVLLPQAGGLHINYGAEVTLIKCNIYRNEAAWTVRARIFYPCATIQRANA